MSKMVSVTDWYVMQTIREKLERHEQLTLAEEQFIDQLREQGDRLDLKSLDSGFPEDWL
jgi:hypothetical protein